MSRRISALLPLFLLLPFSLANAKDKNKATLPDFVLNAHTVLVVIDPDAGIPLEAPNANRTAQDEVEKAIMRWGRFALTMEARSADLIILVQKGSGKMAIPTIGGGPVDNRPVILQPTDGNMRVGVQQGHAAGVDAPLGEPETGPHPSAQIGSAAGQI